jgi:azurin
MKFLISLTLLLTPLVSIFAEPENITITGNDTMQFDLKTFEVKSGEKITVTFKNIGKVPKIAMGHNLVFLKKGISAIAFGQKALGAGANANNALPDSVKGDTIAAVPITNSDRSINPFHMILVAPCGRSLPRTLALFIRRKKLR